MDLSLIKWLILYLTKKINDSFIYNINLIPNRQSKILVDLWSHVIGSDSTEPLTKPQRSSHQENVYNLQNKKLWTHLNQFIRRHRFK